ncbi:MAG: restriction endonuclease subunit S [Bacteroidetes bacterium]|nr:restriction endonuclease subunit S [Bacteroidota bacterium]
MREYDSYKDSGIEWLGKVPVHWSEKRLKELATIFGGKDYKHIVSDDGLYDVIGSGGSFEKATEYLYNKESVLLGRKGTIDKPLYVNRAFWAVDTMYFTKIPSYTHGRYFFYLCTTIEFGYYKYGSALPSMTQGDLNRILFFTPALKEQTAIAQYLDTKTQVIDKKVTLLEKKIGYYKLLRKSIINETVTKGLDKTVKLKDSGIDWIGQIPEHWEVIRLKEIGNIETSSVNKKIEEDEDLVSLVNYIDVYNNPNKEIWNRDDYMQVSANIKQIQSKVLQQGDVLFTPSSETIEDIGVSSVVMENLKNTLYSYHVLRLKFNKKIYLNFKKYMLNNDFVQYYFSHSATGTTRKILGLNTFYNLKVLVPPSIEEQTEIATYLDHKTQTIDKIVGNIQTQINTLKELRKTLINDVVTGKIKVVE